MAKAVFTQKADSIYDDLPERHYHFPRTYLKQVEASVGDWIVYYRPRRGAVPHQGQPARTYFAVARLVRVEPDRADPDLFYAIVDQYLEFDEPIPFRREEGVYELGLLKSDGSVSKGSFGRSVRALTDDAFEAIVSAGFSGKPLAWEAIADVEADEKRPILERLVARPYRDRRFRLRVVEAYDNRCAITGLRLLNGGGRPEVQAAHIRPVMHGGPDSIRNGLALSSTAHWLFDRGLVTLDDKLRVIASRALDVGSLGGLVEHGRAAHLPSSKDRHPSAVFLNYHRERVFHE